MRHLHYLGAFGLVVEIEQRTIKRVGGVGPTCLEGFVDIDAAVVVVDGVVDSAVVGDMAHDELRPQVAVVTIACVVVVAGAVPKSKHEKEERCNECRLPSYMCRSLGGMVHDFSFNWLMAGLAYMVRMRSRRKASSFPSSSTFAMRSFTYSSKRCLSASE